jgi:hypothetical protein
MVESGLSSFQNMSRMMMPVLLMCRNIFGSWGPWTHLDAPQTIPFADANGRLLHIYRIMYKDLAESSVQLQNHENLSSKTLLTASKFMKETNPMIPTQ